MKRKRPFSVTLLVLGVLSFAGLHLLRFLQAIQQWQFLENLPGVSPLYLSITGLIWAGAGLGVAFSLWFGKAWGRSVTLAFAVSYAIYAWVDRLFAANVSLGIYEGSAWPFRVIATFILLGLIFWILTRPPARTFFRSDA